MSDAQLKHLEFIQAVISRQAGNSFLIKGWALTVAAAFDAIAAKTLDWRLALVGVLPALAFGWLDAYFLRQERLFRCLYSKAVIPDTPVPLMSMDPSPYKDDEYCSWWAVLKSKPLWVLYGGITVIALVVLGAALLHHSPTKASRTRSASASSTASSSGWLGGQIGPILSSRHLGTM